MFPGSFTVQRSGGKHFGWWGLLLPPNTILSVILLVCFLWIVHIWLSNLQVSNLRLERIGRGGRNLWVQDVSLTYPTFQSDTLFLYSKGPVVSTSRGSAALLICKSVPLLPEIRSRIFKHKFNLPLQASQVTQLLKNPPAMQETLVQFLVRKICWRRDRLPTPIFLGFHGGSAGKESTRNAGDLGLPLSTIILTGPSQEMGGTDQCFCYHNPLCRPLDCHFLHSTRSFTTPFSLFIVQNCGSDILVMMAAYILIFKSFSTWNQFWNTTLGKIRHFLSAKIIIGSNLTTYLLFSYHFVILSFIKIYLQFFGFEKLFLNVSHVLNEI